jgi:predicted TIM-barrel fold metal-dependent hydrolase
MTKIVLVSADGHTSAEPEAFRPYLEQRYHADLDGLVAENAEWQMLAKPVQNGHRTPEILAVIDGRGALVGGRDDAAAADMKARLKELDAEGVVAELLLPAHSTNTTPWFGTVNRPHPPELRAAGARAYHRWLAAETADSGGRLYGVAEAGPCLDMDATVSELHWVAENGLPATMVPGFTLDPDLPPLYSDYFEPFWAACADAGLVLMTHAGWGAAQGSSHQFLEFVVNNMGGKFPGPGEPMPEELTKVIREMMSKSKDSPMVLQLGPRRILWQLMLGGVFDRHPELKLVLTETRADWIPATLAHLDARASELETPLTMQPSEYFARNCAMTPSSPHRAEIAMRDEIGIDRFMFGMDMPHREGTWPNTWEWIRDAFRGVPEPEARKILGENAIDTYGMDRAALVALAERIGPEPSDLLGDFTVDPQLIEDFNDRAGYAREAEVINTESIDEALRADLAGVGSGS